MIHAAQSPRYGDLELIRRLLATAQPFRIHVAVVAVLTLVANLVADVAYGIVDPRIRLAGRRR